ncbi:MAG: restriction endonuclease [Candidatus Aenigmarchaeota archaeon]|nr:restriction endonuclease [Candidatus Aenigmarchaeota archaeon]
MPIPDYETVMLPLLKFLSDGQNHKLSEAVECLAPQFNLSESERKIRLKSGVLKFDNKVAFAKTYLKQAGLLELLGSGFFRLTKRGQDILNENLKNLDVEFLMRFPEFVDFRGRIKSSKGKEDRAAEAIPNQNLVGRQMPEELIEAGYGEILQSLKRDILQQVMLCSPKFFEKMVVELLVKIGYGGSLQDAGQAIGGSGDAGIDGIIKEDKLGLDAIYIQAKRWENNVAIKDVRDFVGSLVGKKATKGVFITTSDFPKDAHSFVQSIQQKVVLINGEQLAQLMIDHDLGVSRQASYDIKKVDADYFIEE